MSSVEEFFDKVQSVRMAPDRSAVDIIDQTVLPGTIRRLQLKTKEEIWQAIKKLQVRGAPAIGVAAAYGVALLPGIEVNTAEEIHLLCYLPDVATALELSGEIYDRLPDIRCDEAVFGAQVLMDEDDRELGRVDKLLVSGCSFTLAEICARCRQLGGVPVPAHVDRESYSILSVLGLMPDEPSFAAVELHDPSRLEGLVAGGRLPAGYEILSSSDAHYLRDIATAPRTLAADSVLQPLLKRL